MAKPRMSEVGPGTPKAPEGISQNGVIFARRVSTVARVRGIRNAHIAQLGSIFFTTNKFGKVIFYPVGGRLLLNALFINPSPLYTRFNNSRT